MIILNRATHPTRLPFEQYLYRGAVDYLSQALKLIPSGVRLLCQISDACPDRSASEARL